MKDIYLEDCIILWDCSRSMIRKTFKISRLRLAQYAIKHFIKAKLNIDPKDRIGIIIFGSRTKKLSGFSSEYESILKNLSKFEILGKTNLSDGISFAIQILVKEIQKVGGKVSRIFIITDNSRRKISERLQKIIKLAKGLQIFIDTCIISEKEPESTDVLKKITSETNGEYAYFTNLNALLRGIEGFASKKITKEFEDYFNPNKKSNVPELISEIAIDLRRPNINEVRDMMKNNQNYKCQICYQNKCPVCNSPFYAEGRFCPSCGRPIHLHCAAQWASKSEFLEKNIFRCPFCYFLLRIPKTVQKLMKATGGKAIKIIDEEGSFGKSIRMEQIPDNEVSKIDDACSYCNIIFTGDDKVYKCSNCKSYYHETCLEKMQKEIKACRVCGRSFEF